MRWIDFPPLLIPVALVLVSRAGAAEPTPRVTLAWSASPVCSSESGVQEEVARILGPGTRTEGTVTARVRAEQTARGAWHVEIETDVAGSTSHRSLEAESCEAASAGVAFILALTVQRGTAQAVASPLPRESTPSPMVSEPLDGGAELERVADPTVGDSGVESEPAADAVVGGSGPTDGGPDSFVPQRGATGLSEPTVRRFLGRPLSLHPLTVAIGLTTDQGTLPQFGFGVRGALGLSFGQLHFELSGSDWGAATQAAATGPGGARFRLLSAEARGRYVWTFGQFAAGPFVGAGAESLSATGYGGTHANFASTKVFPAITAGGTVVWHAFGPFTFRLDVGGQVAVLRPSFAVLEPAPEPAAPVHTVAPVSGRATFGTEIDF